MNSKLFKSQANDALSVNDRSKIFALIVLIGTAVSFAVSSVTSFFPEVSGSMAMILSTTSTITSLFISFVYSPLYSYALANTALKVIRDEDISLNDLLSGLSCIGLVIIYGIVTSLLTLLGFVAFVVPGIMLTYSYAMGYFIIAEDPSISASDARKKSAEMMKGYKFELFKLDFSFVGWYILSLLTLGILMLWVIPKYQTARAAFYKKLKEIHYGETEHPADAYEAPAAFEQASEPTDYDPDKFSDLR